MAEALKKEPTAEQHSFAAETARVLHLMIHALYTNRDIFLRELISQRVGRLRPAALRGADRWRAARRAAGARHPHHGGREGEDAHHRRQRHRHVA
ncbi:MAG: hypothetical protein WDN72_09395 [Alphaproteobacteria bacterium]